jgi:predicted GNAT superfamily acetyltransferase
MLRKTLFFSLVFILVMLSGCINRRGVSATYYNDCHEYYDARGYYHKTCDKNIVDYKDVEKVFKKKPKPHGNVWQP